MHDPYVAELQACPDRRAVANCLLKKSMTFAGAPMGNVQILNRKDDVLEIVAQSGFGQNFLHFFRAVKADGQSVCARALRRGETVAVEDVATVNMPPSYHAVFAEAEVRAVQSLPLIASDGTLVGMLSTHFHQAVKLDAADLLTMRRQATLAANRLVMMPAIGPESPGAAPAHRGPSKESRHAWSKLVTGD